MRRKVSAVRRRVVAHVDGGGGQSAGDEGMTTAEYAVGTVAACAFAAVLFKVVTGASVLAELTHLIDTALASLS